MTQPAGVSNTDAIVAQRRLLDELLEAKPQARGRNPTWGEIVLVRAAEAWREAKRLGLTGGTLQAVQSHLASAVAPVHQPLPPLRRFRTWWNGSSIEGAWRRFHAVDVILLEHMSPGDLQARISGIYEYARKYLGDQDQRIIQLHAAVGRLIGSIPPAESDAPAVLSPKQSAP